ncbi:MAG TPA: zinc-ribbon domain-containing protein [Myxococcota bacterium]|nr:zinc-ribbon domain-containing protein [Myxococcota bacterium]HRR74429.1 zinc-ribbon domain-containing protein [Myxococcota bacterium]
MGNFLERRYKTLFILVKIYEILGWILTITIIGAFIGIPMILFAQTILVQVSTEDNTRKSLDLLARLVKASGPGGVTNALAFQSAIGGEQDEPEVMCPKCGTTVEPDDTFCGECGASLRV